MAGSANGNGNGEEKRRGDGGDGVGEGGGCGVHVGESADGAVDRDELEGDFLGDSHHDLL